MVRESDVNVRQHFKETNGIFECIYCGKEFKGKPSVTRLRHHLSGKRKGGIRPCEKVSEHVKTDVQTVDPYKRRRMLESDLVNDEMPNPASTSLPPSDNHLVEEQAVLQNEFHGTKQVFLESCNPEPMPKQLRTCQGRSISLLTSELVGELYKIKLEEIRSSLMKEDVFKIGIYGMGGAGKTELARHIYNKLLEQAEYDFVCWITVSPHFSIRKLQNIIANAINFELPNKDVEIIRAELSRRLLDKKFVIILDDLWSYISLHDLGMTDGSMNGCKLVMTTRSLDICRTMNCQKNVLVDCHEYAQADEEGWNIFKKELGKEGILSGEIETVAKDIVRECQGLPMLIKCMGRSMRGLEDIEEWRNALEEMRSGKMNEEVFQQLKRSYDHLKDQSLRHCFLYSALFQGHADRKEWIEHLKDQSLRHCFLALFQGHADRKELIEHLKDQSLRRCFLALFQGYADRKELIEHLIVEGIIERRGNRRAKFDRAHSLLNKLRNVCLVCLLSGDSDYVWMHGLIRKMAFQIMKEKLPSKLDFSEDIIYLFMKDKMRISLNVKKEALNPCDYVAACPNVSTLLILSRNCLKFIEDSFSDRFQNLKVLNLSRSNIVELPKSVGCLKNLKALFLGGCNKLEQIPSLAKLESLEVLDLSYCAVEKVPKGLERLSNLRVLNLIGSYIEEIEAGILKRLSSLEFLAFDSLSKMGEEIGCLSKLESLIWWFSDIDEFDSFLSNARSPSLNAYFIYVGQFDGDEFETAEPSGRKMWFCAWEIERRYLFCLSSCLRLLERVEEVRLDELSNLSHLFRREIEYEASPNTTTIRQTYIFSDLKTFHMSDCYSIENVFPLHLLSNLQNLQELSVSSCSEMVEIIAAPEQDLTYADSHPNSTQTRQFSLPKLKTLSLKDLPKLTSICPVQINCESLDYIRIVHCENLEKIPISLPLPSLQMLEVYPETWWKSVSWDSKHQKDILQPRFTWF